MTTLQLLIVCTTVLAVVAIVAATRMASPASASEPHPHLGSTGSTLVVHTSAGRSFRGVATEGAPGSVRLEEATLLVDGQAQPVGGTVRIACAHVEWTQELR